MRKYVALHGQAAGDGGLGLSQLGCEQARLLGDRLTQIGFQGRIISSPDARSMETAQIITGATGCPVTPFEPFCEAGAGDMSQSIARLERLYPDTELLLIGGSMACDAMLRALEIPKPIYENRICFNCSLSCIDRQDPGVPTLYCDTAHVKYEQITRDQLTREQYDGEYIRQPWRFDFRLPEELRELKGKVVLHIGDTASWQYPFYRRLIDEVKPEIILHTGDMADEVKVGRIPGTRYEYLFKIKFMLDILDRSGAELVIVPGNNDLPQEIQKLCPRAQVCPRDTVLTLDGVPCRVGHEVDRMTFDKEWSFYGHGLTGETWHLEDNYKGKPHRFNAAWGAFVCCIQEDRFVHIPVPDEP